MTFSMHCISCTRGMGIISLGSLSLVSFRFFHPITLAYVTSRVWRPPWGHYFTLCLTAHTWAILELGRWLFLRAWWMGSWDDDLHWVIPLLSVMDFQRRHYLHWGIPRSSMTVSLWDDPTLGHSHFRERFYWRYSHSTRYSALGHILLIDGWFFEMMAYFETWLLQRLCVHWGMTLTLFWGHILRHNCLIGDGLWLFIGA